MTAYAVLMVLGLPRRWHVCSGGVGGGVNDSLGGFLIAQAVLVLVTA